MFEFRQKWVLATGRYAAVLLFIGACSSDKSATSECSDEGCENPRNGGLNTDWHPDPDGDGVLTTKDVCPYTYDPGQIDTDSDEVGDECDDDFFSLSDNGSVSDLVAQHVTPYGGWFSFTSASTTQYGQDYWLAWSETRSDLATQSALIGLPSDNKYEFRVFNYKGKKLSRPQIVTSMQPDTTYFVTVRPLDDNDDPRTEEGRILEIKTAAAPTMGVSAERPRVWASAEQLSAIAERHQSDDTQFGKWAAEMGPSALSNASNDDPEEYQECLSAALLFHATGEDRYRDAALAFIDSMLGYWQGRELSGNQLRWANSNLPICTDLMWNELGESERNTIVSAFLEDDEGVALDRYDDTDEYASITRNWVVDGLIACGASGLQESLSDRGCQLLEKGLRSFYGVQLVKARRDHGFFAQSGGGLPDGIGYAWGTSAYWLQTIHALANVGGDMDLYANWVWNNLLSMEIHALTPMRRGHATFGDLDSYNNFSLEPNSIGVAQHRAGLIALQMGILEGAGMPKRAGHARWHLDNLFEPDNFGFGWAPLLFAHDGIAPQSNEEGIGTAFFDSGMGMFYDRTGWALDDSFFVYRAGWSGVDHHHEDLGSFQLYRKGVWLTHEALGYDGPAATAVGHNVPVLTISNEDSTRVGQFRTAASAPARADRVSATDTYSYVASDLLGAYSSARYHSFSYDTVERHILWLKPTASNSDDRLVIYDLIDNQPEGAIGTRAFQMHIDEAPELSGAQASFQAGSFVQVNVPVPSGVSMSYESPQGQHSQYPGEIYTGRLVADADASSQDKRELRYVTLIRASDTANPKPVLGIESADVVGVLSDTELVIFPRHPDPDIESQSLTLNANGSLTVYWTGLHADGKYEIGTSQSDGRITLTLTLGGSHTADPAGVVVAKITP